MKPSDSFYQNQEEPNKSCFLALRQIILDQNSAISETVKYGMPCFCFNEKPFCYLWSDKKTNEPYILMVEGRKLRHPILQQGDRKRMKTLTINANQDLPIDIIKAVLQEAIALCSK